jgi:benzoate membrane transport protein
VEPALSSSADTAAPSLVQPIVAGLLAAVVGFGSSFAVVVAGLRGVGASPAEAASGLVALTIGMGLLGIATSLYFRMPISIAWSTPGGALLATSGTPGGFAEAVGAFLIVGALIAAAGLWRPLGRLVASIPKPLASAMLAGILLPLVLAPFKAVGEMPLQALAILAVWVVVGRFSRLYAVPAAVAATVVVIAIDPAGANGAGAALWPDLLIVAPAFSWQAFVGIALPLFIVTMASQNIPGLAVLGANGYRPPPGPLLTATGVASILVAPFGALTINLAAITAALCAGPEAGADPSRRWTAAAVAGAAYLVIGLFATAAVALVLVSPPILIQAAAGLALLGAFGNSILVGLEDVEDRTAVLVTFLLAASGTSFAGVGSAFWGLLAGLAILALNGRLGAAARKE